MDKKGILEVFKPVIDLASDATPNLLVPEQAQKEEAQAKFLSHIEKFASRILKGYHILLREIDMLRFEDPSFISDDSWDKLNDITKQEEISFSDCEKKDIKSIFGLSENEIDKLYSAADKLFIEERYHEASDALFFISNIEPTNSVFWLALGMSEYFQERWQEAIQAFMFGMAASETPDLRNVVYLAHSYKHLGEKTRARELIDGLLTQFDKTELESLGDLKALREEL